jgi:hypothetical protein
MDELTCRQADRFAVILSAPRKRIRWHAPKSVFERRADFKAARKYSGA